MLMSETKRYFIDKITNPELIDFYQSRLENNEGFEIRVNDPNPFFRDEYFLEIENLNISVIIKYKKDSRVIQFNFYNDKNAQSLLLTNTDFLWSNLTPRDSMKDFLDKNLSDSFFGNELNIEKILKRRGLIDFDTLITKIFHDSLLAIVKLDSVGIPSLEYMTKRVEKMYRQGFFLILGYPHNDYPEVFYIEELKEVREPEGTLFKYELKIDRELPDYVKDFCKENYKVFIL